MSLRGTISTTATAVIALAVAVGTSGCSEKPQTASARKTDAKGWDLSRSGSLADGWKGGDQAAWEQQLRTRAEAQNEYPRSAQRSAPAPVVAAASSPLAPKTP
ncbi:MAG: hypothetical protein ABIQ29_04650 [Burkholderiaceae bacterium]